MCATQDDTARRRTRYPHPVQGLLNFLPRGTRAAPCAARSVKLKRKRPVRGRLHLRLYDSVSNTPHSAPTRVCPWCPLSPVRSPSPTVVRYIKRNAPMLTCEAAPCRASHAWCPPPGTGPHNYAEYSTHDRPRPPRPPRPAQNGSSMFCL